MSETRQRKIARAVRFTPEEWALVKQAAFMSQKTVSAYLRETALGAKPRLKNNPEQMQAIQELSNLTKTLEQVRSGVSDHDFKRQSFVLLNEISAKLQYM
jgi:hypothetical protein